MKPNFEKTRQSLVTIVSLFSNDPKEQVKLLRSAELSILQPDGAAPTEQAAPLFAHAPSEKHKKFIKQDSEKQKRLVIAAYEHKKEQLKNNPHLKRKFIIEELSKDFNLSISTIYKYVQGR